MSWLPKDETGYRQRQNFYKMVMWREQRSSSHQSPIHFRSIKEANRTRSQQLHTKIQVASFPENGRFNIGTN